MIVHTRGNNLCNTILRTIKRNITRLLIYMFYQTECINWFISESSRYQVGEKGFKDCVDQGMLNIMNEDECKDACEELKIQVDRLKNNAICFKAGNKKCRQQDAKGGAKTSRICKKEGILPMYT